MQLGTTPHLEETMEQQDDESLESLQACVEEESITHQRLAFPLISWKPVGPSDSLLSAPLSWGYRYAWDIWLVT